MVILKGAEEVSDARGHNFLKPSMLSLSVGRMQRFNVVFHLSAAMLADDGCRRVGRAVGERCGYMASVHQKVSLRTGRG